MRSRMFLKCSKCSYVEERSFEIENCPSCDEPTMLPQAETEEDDVQEHNNKNDI